MRTKIRVAMFTDVLRENLDGVTHTLYNIIERVPRDRFDYLFITPYPPSENVPFPFPVITCRYVRFPMYGDYPLAIPYFDKKLAAALEAFKPDIVHFTSPSFLGRYALRYARNNKIPVVSTYHTHFPMYVEYYFKHIPGLVWFTQKFIVPPIIRFYYNKCNLVYVPTLPVLEELVDMGVERRRLTIWARGINTDEFSPKKRDIPYIEQLTGTCAVRILFVSRLYWIKEIKTIIEIYRRLRVTHPHVTMIITGDGPQRHYMEKHMPKAVFTGKIPHRDLPRLYASCDIFLFPSITETFGNVNLEALASGLPVVAAAKGGPLGIVRDGETGYLAQPKNVDDFCDKLARLIDNPAELRRMSKNAAAYARTQSWGALCKEMFQSYERIVAESREMVEELNEASL